MIKRGISLLLSFCVMMLGFGYAPKLVTAAEENNLALATNGATATEVGGRGTGCEPEKVIDGITDTGGWQGKSGATESWVQVKLAKPAAVDRIEFYSAKGIDRYYTLSYSLTGEEWTTLSNLTRTTIVDGSVYNYSKSLSGIVAQYVRVQANVGNVAVREIEVYGEPLNPYLSKIMVDGELLEGFDKNINTYDILVASADELPNITATADDISLPEENIVITQANSGTMKAIIEVRLGGEGYNYAYTHTYTVNMISQEECAYLKSITLSKGELSPEFSMDMTDYTTYIGGSDEIPQVSAVALSDTTDVVITQATADNMTARVLATAQNGTQKTYTINFIRTDASLKSIKIDGQAIENFDPDVRVYNIDVDDLDSYTYPEVTAEALCDVDNDSISITQPTEEIKQALITVTSKLGSTRTYTVNFRERIAFSNIALNSPVKGSNSYSATPLSKAVDGDYSTKWQTNISSTEYSQITITLPDIAKIDSIVIWEAFSTVSDWWKNENITYSIDGENWNTISAEQTMYGNLHMTGSTGRERIYKLTVPTYARYVRYKAGRAGKIQLNEIEIYGEVINPYLNSIVLPEGYTLMPEFDSSITYYDVFVNLIDELLPENIRAEQADSSATVAISGQNSEQMTIAVTTSDGGYTHRYTINKILKGSDTNLKSVTLSKGELSPEFSRDVTEYTTYIGDSDEIPKVSAVALSDTTDVVITQATEDNMTASVLATAQNGTQKTYAINFIRTEASLKFIKIDGQTIEDFAPNVRVYNIYVDDLDSYTYPEVTAEALCDVDNDSVSITQATAATKQAVITVTSKLGITKTYAVNFKERIAFSNLAHNSQVGGSNSYTNTGVSKAVDGDYNTKWQTNISSTDYAYITITLPDIAKIDAIVFWETFTTNNDWWKNENITYSIDGENWNTISAEQTMYGNLTGSTARERIYKLTVPTYARYVRYDSPRGGNFQLNELEIYGEYCTGAYLKDIELSHDELSGRFDPRVNIYDVFVASEDNLPTITAVAEAQGITPVVVNATRETMQATVSVTNGDFTNVYVFNMIPRYVNTQLNKLSIDSWNLIPKFSRDITEYTVYLKPDVKFPNVTVETRSPNATVRYTYADTDDENPQTVVRVTSGGEEDVFTEYKVNFIRTSPNLETLTAGDNPIFPAFNPEHYSYSVVLEDGEALPTVSAEPQYAVMSKEIKQPTSSTMEATVTVSSYLNIERSYTVKFYRRKNNQGSARLSYISFSDNNYYINEVFDPNKTEYTVNVTNRKNLPGVSPVTEDSNATYSITPADSKGLTATITVTGDGGETKTYKVYYLINTALGKSAWESSKYNGTEATKAVDGKLNTYWGASSGATQEWIICNLEDGAKIHRIVVHTSFSSSPEFYNVIMASDDGREWRNINVTHKLESLSGTNDYKFTFSFEPFDAKYVKVTGTRAGKTRIAELELWGIPEPTVSANSYLKNLEFSNGVLTPAFSPYITNYAISLDKNAPLPTITACETVNESATFVITQATPSTMQTVVEITAENGISKTVYTVNMVKEVVPEKNTYLSSLLLSAGEISPAFSPKNTSYTVYLTQGAAIPDVTAIPEVSGATAIKSTAGNTMQITVTSADTTESRIYTLNFVHVNAELSAISVPGATLKPALAPGIYSYTAEMAAGAVLPTVSATAAGDASIVITQPDEKTKQAIILVKLNSSNYTKKYTIDFTFRQSIEEAVAAALDKVKKLTVTNDTTANDIMSAVQSVVTNGDITLTWKTPFSKTEATSSKNGFISAVISLTLSGKSANIEVRKTLSKLSDGTPSGGGGGGGGGTVSLGEPSIDNQTILNITAKPNENTDIYKEVRGHWAEKAVIALSEKGIVKGNGTSFALENAVTRAEFIAMLVRACNFELPPYSNTFTDVNSSDWFAQSVEAAKERGIVSGYDGKFNPYGTASREEAVKMLVSACELLNGEIAIENDIAFTDSHNISTWAILYVQKAVGKNLVHGFDTGEFLPKATLTRAQAMTLVYRLIGDNEDAEEMR